ncbi:MAG TPA: type II toxin-antitoxin system VapB family antitoxin [Opitutaceae bacterium]
MTMHIDEDVLAQVMEITGAKSKTQAVEIALKEMARRHKQRKLFAQPLELTPEQWDAEAASKPSDQFDPPDIDPDSIKRWDAAMAEWHKRRQASWQLNEPPAPPPSENPEPPPADEQSGAR